MAFRATNDIPEQALARAKDIAVQVRGFSQNHSNAMASGGDSTRVLRTLEGLLHFRDELNAVKTTPGLAQYAKDQENDAAYDVVAEFTALVLLIEDTATTIVASFPTDASSYLLANKFNGDGTLSPRAFTAGQLSGIKAKLDAVVAGVV